MDIRSAFSGDKKMSNSGRSVDPTNVVRTLWHGTSLSPYEELSLLSFVRCGHEVEVYAYNELEVPPGVLLRDANAILPESDAFPYSDGPAKGSFAAFSNLFRMKLLWERGGIWSDLDVLCLRSLDTLPAACVAGKKGKWANGAVMRFPPGHPACEKMYARAAQLGESIHLGQTGQLINSVLAERDDCDVVPSSFFQPIPWEETWRLVDPSEYAACENATRSSFCVHWWNTAITMGIGIPKDALPPRGSYLYEKATAIFGDQNLKAWPESTVSVWVNNFRKAQLAADNSDQPLTSRPHLIDRPVAALLKSDLRTVFRDCVQIARSVRRRFG
jgi:hypothetical protein